MIRVLSQSLRMTGSGTETGHSMAITNLTTHEISATASAAPLKTGFRVHHSSDPAEPVVMAA
ncbi:hypothetical protein [Paracoccus sp. SCSIO 75233]|uniref:hypothetical protein n=1 Tax=Paracoccus sp. SCSIO 75233 TaxID=3017782 RepID=UPI0022F12ABE|nr:hypothetical protein [Paracoccus sp. SCSIO 75233]WBU54316.1 hypothetical protein PAF12_05640 [Paracoccus sp. SCSIO 75233]